MRLNPSSVSRKMPSKALSFAFLPVGWVLNAAVDAARPPITRGGGGMSGTIGDYARFLQMLLNEGELDGVRVLRAETVRQMTQNATGNMPTLRGPGWGFTLGFGIVTDLAAAKTRLPAGSYGWGGIYGTQFWIDPTNRVVGLVMTQTAIIGGPIANPIREAFYAAD